MRGMSIATTTTPEATAADQHLTLAATWRREVGASVERILENVFDWEHLPSLHDSYFTSVALLEGGASGWRVRLSRPPDTQDRIQVLRLEVDRAHQRYTVLTEEGIGAGTRFWTLMRPLAPHRTAIEVRYYLPEHRPERIATLAGKYLSSCERLWSEDEAMMRHRESMLARLALEDAAPPPAQAPVPLGPVARLRAALPLVVEFGGRPFRIVELADGAIVAHSTRCPHWLGPLDAASLEDGCVVRCPWHGWRFDVRTGASADGRALRLAEAPEIVIDARGDTTLVGRRPGRD